ncbi:non-canonical purine NTP pyrophosphatase [Pseudomonas putida]|uniref:Non-canonical purine NTP pyrophosphatase n=1 Tax=Pseudomonas putida TaxID=303 RepID=A0A8I1EAN9_PSEPU|nr:non-canonical purine NTP pyrophosphatase [Pseudomonas putida]MBI6882462.1 non-canonical purine NTP pyrophosphatase [Pseudomonas putida]
MRSRFNPPSLADFVVVTSNAEKIAEYARFAGPNLRVEPGTDLEEVLGTPDEIIIHKAIAAGEGRMVEDAIMWINGEPHVDVRWKIPALLRGEYPMGASLVWEVRLGVLHNGVVYAYVGQTHGTLQAFDVEGMGMDPVFRVDSTGKTLAAMVNDGTKDQVSARRHAATAVFEGSPYLAIVADQVKPWTGLYQGD